VVGGGFPRAAATLLPYRSPIWIIGAGTGVLVAAVGTAVLVGVDGTVVAVTVGGTEVFVGVGWIPKLPSMTGA